VGAFTSGLVTFILVLVLTFLFLKDGPSFLPWLRRRSGPTAGAHLTEMFTRMWSTLGSFIRIQALVSLIDAVLIGLGLVILGVPLAAPLAVITFFARFVPIVGAIAAGALAVVVALVSNGPTTALLVIGVIVVVQQLESNVLQPLLQGKSLELPAAVVLLSVTIGGTLFGISGAFLAVPVVATAATALRYLDQQVALRAGETAAEDVTSQTRAGDRMALRAQAWRQRRRRTDDADG
jgi:predicted PurR-regulated permease PerM